MQAVPNVIALATPVVASLLALGAYRYKNRIGFTVTTIDGDLGRASERIKTPPYAGHLYAERLRLKNYGFRALENVELHYIMSSEPEIVTVKSPTTLSKSAIKASWADGLMTITAPHLPSGEEVSIDTIRLGHYDTATERLRGTGGKYKVVRLEDHELKRDTFWLMAPYFLFLIYLLLVSLGL